MTTTVERTFDIDAPIEDVWELLADPTFRAEGISVVDSYTVEEDETVWQLYLPLRFLPGRITVRTRDVERDPPRFVRFVGESSVMDVEGEHELTATETGCLVRNQFVVDGKLPGVERFFEHHIDGELTALIELVADRLSVTRSE